MSPTFEGLSSAFLARILQARSVVCPNFSFNYVIFTLTTYRYSGRQVGRPLLKSTSWSLLKEKTLSNKRCLPPDFPLHSSSPANVQYSLVPTRRKAPVSTSEQLKGSIGLQHSQEPSALMRDEAISEEGRTSQTLCSKLACAASNAPKISANLSVINVVFAWKH